MSDASADAWRWAIGHWECEEQRAMMRLMPETDAERRARMNTSATILLDGEYVVVWYDAFEDNGLEMATAEARRARR